ncbi:SDR family oxidoreductase [Rhodalgimonas zhirmunskyi]|uniref:SDR family oxidoreductase n=1 Tax=Rhodalgimonas zhirmunskyi TaxID=2964767 RepID=A0AAJ1X6I0_9RHOB|nr:SDR family oxidoreductase [Rhodoalgimonas zhirmunskyi]MDQ2094734.1 SDR family oxidoreductase [Rhodoalgimonas zhirmunskyi]
MEVKRALVTGAGKRLGRAMALYLGERGFDVAVHYAQSDKGAQEVAQALRDMGRKAAVVQADLLSLEACDTLVTRAAEALGGPLSCLVNNASIFENDALQDATHESWDRHFGSNLRAPFILSQHFAAQAPAPVEDSQGEPLAQALIVNMVDQRVLHPGADFMTYTLAKSALWTLTRTAAKALAPAIRVNAIGPGPTLQGAHQSADDFAQERASTPLTRGAGVQDITAALGYFIDAPAVTGQLICVDGGQHLGG